MSGSLRGEVAAPPPHVAAVFDDWPADIRSRLLEVRRLILDTAAATEGVGEIEETLKWGQPAYLTSECRSGSTIRIAPMKGEAGNCALFFNCQTSLVETFRHWFPKGLRFEGNRALVLDVAKPLPTVEVTECVAAALTYHRRDRRG